jgi:predicted AlkP superfamily phosphohydrolase/phosphomutase
MSRVLLFGLDGATFDVINPLIAAGQLPNLAHIMKTGASGPLRSTIPPITPTAWTSVFTGKNPGKHGIYDFQELDPDTYQRKPVRVNRHREKSLWTLLGETGKRSIVIDVPFTYPPHPLNGLMITGYGTPRTAETIFTYPTNFKSILPPALHSEIRVGIPQHRFDRSQALIDEWREVMNGRSRLLQHLIKNEAWDFFFAVLTITDNMGHIFWTYLDPNHPNYHKSEGSHFREAFLDGYKQCDVILGELLAVIDSNTTILIMSDHGFGSIYPRQYLFQRLVDGDYLRYLQASGLGSLSSRAMKVALRTYNELPFLREWVKGLRPGNKQTLTKALGKGGLLPGSGQVDYANSPILPTEFGLQMWANDQNRFTNGLIAASEKETLLAGLEQYLQDDTESHTKQPIIRKTYRGKALYTGETAVLGPDLVIEYNNFYQPGSEKTHLNPHLEGGHTPEGIFLAAGTAVQPTTISGTTLIDLAPTILHLLGQPIPPDMDGKVLLNVFTPEYNAQYPIIVGDSAAQHTSEEKSDLQTLSTDQEDELMDQLRQLGYVE